MSSEDKWSGPRMWGVHSLVNGGEVPGARVGVSDVILCVKIIKD